VVGQYAGAERARVVQGHVVPRLWESVLVQVRRVVNAAMVSVAIAGCHPGHAGSHAQTDGAASELVAVPPGQSAAVDGRRASERSEDKVVTERTAAEDHVPRRGTESTDPPPDEHLSRTEDETVSAPASVGQRGGSETVELSALSRVHGKVVDDMGCAVAGVTVRAYPLVRRDREPSWIAASEKSSAAGEFLFSGLTSRQYRIRCYQEALANTERTRPRRESYAIVTIPSREPLLCILPRSARVRGRVKSMDGTPLGDIGLFLDPAVDSTEVSQPSAVELTSWSGLGNHADEAPQVLGRLRGDLIRAASDGTFDSGDIPPGEYTLVTEDPWIEADSKLVRVEAGASAQVDLVGILRGKLEVWSSGSTTKGEGIERKPRSVQVLDLQGREVELEFERRYSDLRGKPWSVSLDRFRADFGSSGVGALVFHAFLCEGRYECRVHVEDESSWTTSFEVKSGALTAVAIPSNVLPKQR